MSHLTRGAFALAALSLFPFTAVAQQSTGSDPVQVVADNQSADRLYERALTLEADVGSWVEAAKLYARSAQLRPYGDVRAYVAYERAGHLLFAKNRPEKARQMFAKAGDRALQAGHVYEAAEAYFNAAELVALHRARPVNEQAGMTDYEMALRLSVSPVLTEEQRVRLRSRTRA